jgi:hypothetical protein
VGHSASQGAPVDPLLNTMRRQAASFPFALPQAGISKMSESHQKISAGLLPHAALDTVCGHHLCPQHLQKLQLPPPRVCFPCKIARLSGPKFPRLSSGSIYNKTSELHISVPGSIYKKPGKKLSPYSGITLASRLASRFSIKNVTFCSATFSAVCALMGVNEGSTGAA